MSKRRTTFKTGPDNPQWKGGKTLDILGYISVCTGFRQRQREHRAVMASLLGYELLPNEQVHHLNGVTWDNRAENLELLEIAEHGSMSRLRRIDPLATRVTLASMTKQWAVYLITVRGIHFPPSVRKRIPWWEPSYQDNATPYAPYPSNWDASLIPDYDQPPAATEDAPF